MNKHWNLFQVSTKRSGNILEIQPLPAGAPWPEPERRISDPRPIPTTSHGETGDIPGPTAAPNNPDFVMDLLDEVMEVRLFFFIL